MSSTLNNCIGLQYYWHKIALSLKKVFWKSCFLSICRIKCHAKAACNVFWWNYIALWTFMFISLLFFAFFSSALIFYENLILVSPIEYLLNMNPLKSRILWALCAWSEYQIRFMFSSEACSLPRNFSFRAIQFLDAF